jgi:hypothetical protein
MKLWCGVMSSSAVLTIKVTGETETEKGRKRISASSYIDQLHPIIRLSFY